MPEHQIRLRGGWQWHDPKNQATDASRLVTLPIRWPSGVQGLVRLVRHFGSPPVDADNERIALRLENVPGLVAAQLNGRELTGNSDGGWHTEAPFEIELRDPLAPRNMLVLDVDPPTPREGDWGHVSLVIRSGP
jgi:hypothetical protein